jgi:hypothetical protein
MITLIVSSILYFLISFIILIEIRKFVDKLCLQNFINIAKHILFQFAITAVYLLNVGVTPTPNQTNFLVISFLCATIYLIVYSLKSNDILSLIFGILIVSAMISFVLWICFNIVSIQKVSNMIKALVFFFVFIFAFLLLYKLVPKHKFIYIWSVLLLGIMGTILLFSAYFYPEEASYKSIHNTIYNWGKISPYSSTDDVLYTIQNILLKLCKAILPVLLGFIVTEKLKKISRANKNDSK